MRIVFDTSRVKGHIIENAVRETALDDGDVLSFLGDDQWGVKFRVFVRLPDHAVVQANAIRSR